MLSHGDRRYYSDVTFPRAAAWAARVGYSVVLIKEALHHEGERPHYGKLRIPELFPGFDRYCIIDDDLMISSLAPELPGFDAERVGLCRDAEQGHTTNPMVKWTANTGFVVVQRGGLDLLGKACDRGDDETVWGIADQGALNSVAWSEGRIEELNPLWNYQGALEYFIRGKGWGKWVSSRMYRCSFYLILVFGIPHPVLSKIRKCYGFHMIRCPYPRFFDRIIPK